MAPRMAGCVGDVDDAADRDRREPEHHDRAEPGRHRGRAPALDGEQHHQNGDADVQHVRVEARRHEIEAFDGGKHRDRRRDDGVAVEQRRADHAEPDHEPAALAHDALDERHEAERAALAAIVHAHDEKHVFERHDHDQGPEDQGHDAEHGFAGHRAAGRRGRQAFLQRIERARADVAIDDADGAERQRPEPPPVGRGGQARSRSWDRVRPEAVAELVIKGRLGTRIDVVQCTHLVRRAWVRSGFRADPNGFHYEIPIRSTRPSGRAKR